MISDLVYFLNSIGLAINFVAHLLIFFGILYVAVYNTRLPKWHITPLWYFGCFNLLTSLTVLVQWFTGAEHPLSYWNFGSVTEAGINMSLVLLVGVMFLATFKQKERSNENKSED